MRGAGRCQAMREDKEKRFKRQRKKRENSQDYTYRSSQKHSHTTTTACSVACAFLSLFFGVQAKDVLCCVRLWDCWTRPGRPRRVRRIPRRGGRAVHLHFERVLGMHEMDFKHLVPDWPKKLLNLFSQRPLGPSRALTRQSRVLSKWNPRMLRLLFY